jgi:hypothetical protein
MTYTDVLVCGLPYPPTLSAWSKDMREDVIFCCSFKLRANKKKEVKLYQPDQLKDGLFKGQIKEIKE